MPIAINIIFLERRTVKGNRGDGTVILFYPIIDENRRFAIFVTYVKSFTCAENKFTLAAMVTSDIASIYGGPLSFVATLGDKNRGENSEQQFAFLFLCSVLDRLTPAVKRRFGATDR
jgi:hypothetical protein